MQILFAYNMLKKILMILTQKLDLTSQHIEGDLVQNELNTSSHGYENNQKSFARQKLTIIHHKMSRKSMTSHMRLLPFS